MGTRVRFGGVRDVNIAGETGPAVEVVIAVETLVGGGGKWARDDSINSAAVIVVWIVV